MNAPNSIFDPSIFLDAQITEVNERRELLDVQNPESPDGLYTAIIGEVKTDSGTIGKGDRAGQPWMSMMVPLKVQVPASMQSAKKLPPELTFTDRVFIDLTPDGRGIDNSPGKNRGQKHYREICDLNKPGDVFAWRMLTGRPVKVRLVHVAVTPTDGSEPFLREELAGVFRAS